MNSFTLLLKITILSNKVFVQYTFKASFGINYISSVFLVILDFAQMIREHYKPVLKEHNKIFQNVSESSYKMIFRHILIANIFDST